MSDSSLSSSEDDDHDDVHAPTDALPDDIFGMTVCSLCRDIFHILEREDAVAPRIGRIATSMFLLALTVCVQIFLLIEIKRYVTPPAVMEVRLAYAMYEEHMYSETVLNVHNHSRGVSGFNASRFYDLSPADQESVCKIPLSRPFFFGSVLFLWTVCNVGDLQTTWGLLWSLVVKTKTCKHMGDALLPTGEKGSKEYMIASLPIWLKVTILLLVVIPRAIITLRVLYLGSRWLLATVDFGELVLNAVALEFILLIRSILYKPFFSERSKIDLERTKVHHEHRTLSTNLASSVGHAFFGVACLAWVALYMGIPGFHQGWQMTLPDYRWDVGEICAGWFETHFCVDPPCHAGEKSLLTYFLQFP